MGNFRVSHLLFMALVIMLSACNSPKGEDKLSATNATDSTSITIKAGNTDLTNILKKNEGMNSVGKDDSSLFESIIADEKITIPYVKIGEVVTINFGDIPADNYVLYDYVLNEDGTIKYSSLATETVSIQVSNNVGTFKLNENLSSKFSSNSKDYEPGNLLRGFLLITTSGDKQVEYAFVIKSDISEAE
ncbi:hypothetical protein D3C73_613150 [compost metagenome]